ncbi:MAG: branched-chain amino acid transport system ATP-binding protein livF [Actinomycetota bacterium]|jgi:branched-chain amino acid transport system ATP-binding protein
MTDRALTSDTTLSIKDVHVRFGGVAALDGVAFDVPRGEIVGIIGPNGAGKTTLFDCISGFRAPNKGSIVLQSADGPVELVGRAPWERTALGVGRTFQNARLFKSLPIREVLRAVQHDRMKRSGFFRSVLGLGGAAADEADVAARGEEVLELVGLSAHADKPARELSTGMLRLAELAAVVAVRPKLLLLDEPSSGIAQKETEALGPLLQRLAGYLEATVLLIEHDMPLVMGISDTIVAMASGAVVTSGTPEEVRSHPEVLRSYLGATA